jgi:hypothetical protein
MSMPRKCITYGKRSGGSRRRRVAFVEQELDDYALAFCAANQQSYSSLINDLIRYLRDEIGKEEEHD